MQYLNLEYRRYNIYSVLLPEERDCDASSPCDSRLPLVDPVARPLPVINLSPGPRGDDASLSSSAANTTRYHNRRVLLCDT